MNGIEVEESAKDMVLEYELEASPAKSLASDQHPGVSREMAAETATG